MGTNDQVILEHYTHVGNIVNDLFPGDIGVAVTDLEKIIFYKPARRIDVGAQVGHVLRPEFALYQAIQQNKRIMKRQVALVRDVPFITYAMPLTNDNNEIIGAISIHESVEDYDALKDMAGRLSDSINILASSSQEISAQTEEISTVSKNLADISYESQQRAKDSDKILGLIRDIASPINLLGLNAAIEAARVGEIGRGFSVVATEIRRLAATTAEAVNNIENIINTIQKDSNQTYQRITQIDGVISQIAQAINNVAETTQCCGSMANELDQMADKVSQVV
jgi:methyl-accepting chemotaxis protein